MSVGDGIFLSAILLSVVGLYATTKDRWQWKRLMKWIVGVPVLLIALLILGVWTYSEYQDRPTVQTEFGGIALTATPADVRFVKGKPIEKHSDADRWVYFAGSGSAQGDDSLYVVQFSDGKVRWIMYWSNARPTVHPWLQGVSVDTPYDAVVRQLGPPSHVATSADGLDRMLSYEKYHTFYSFTQAKVQAFGIYDPNTGPMNFTKAASAPAASAAK